MISTPLSATTSKYEKNQIADHDVADFRWAIGKNIYDIKTHPTASCKNIIHYMYIQLRYGSVIHDITVLRFNNTKNFCPLLFSTNLVVYGRYQ